MEIALDPNNSVINEVMDVAINRKAKMTLVRMLNTDDIKRALREFDKFHMK